MNENVLEFLRNEHTSSVTFSQERFVKQIKKLKEEYPDEVEILHENEDGSIFAHIPTSWIKIRPHRKMTDEQREALSRRARENFHK